MSPHHEPTFCKVFIAYYDVAGNPIRGFELIDVYELTLNKQVEFEEVLLGPPYRASLGPLRWVEFDGKARDWVSYAPARTDPLPEQRAIEGGNASLL